VKLISIYLGFLFVVCVYLEELLVIARFIVLLLAGDMDGADLDLDASHIECLVDGDWDAGEGGRNEGNILFWFVIFVLSVLFIDGAVYVMRRQCRQCK
jgi:hypothetical protein